jgi:hypothetical protein
MANNLLSEKHPSIVMTDLSLYAQYNSIIKSTLSVLLAQSQG